MASEIQIVDSHVHVAPDRIAPVVEEVTARNFGRLAGPMTIDAVLQSMLRHGIAMSGIFNVAQRADLVKRANDFLIESVDNVRLFGLGTIHPDLEHAADEVARLRAHGIKGIKFHAPVQHFAADDRRLYPVYEAMGEDLVAYYHCGKNPAEPDAPVLNSPRAIALVRLRFPRLKIVAAHFGGFAMLEDARKFLMGRDYYLDTSWQPGSEALDPAEMAEFIAAHGCDRVLFGTDYPTVSGVAPQLEWIDRLPLSSGDKELVLSKNAIRLFRLGPAG